MTPELQLSGGETRLGGNHLADAPDTRLPRRSTSAYDGAAAHLSRMSAAQMSPEIDDPELDAVEGTVSALEETDGIPAAGGPGPLLVLDARQLDQVAALFKLLCDKTRLAILQILCEGEMNVTALCRRLKLPQPTVSHHLGLLRMNRLIANRRSGKQVYYKLHERVEDPARSDAGPRVGGLQIVDDGFAVHIATQPRSGASMFLSVDAAVLHTPQ
jgi:ArsR family transcriptional regulator